MKRFFEKILLLFSCVILVSACTKDEEVFTGSILGKITDAETGEPMQDVTVTITPGGLSRTTGADGYFEFLDLIPKQYEIQGRKNGYKTNSKTVTVMVGSTISGDLKLSPVAQNQNMELSVSSLNFGKNSQSLSFEIINNGNVAFNWNVSGFEGVDWLEVFPTAGTLEAGKSNAVKVNVLREHLTESQEVVLIINADKESKALRVSVEF